MLGASVKGKDRFVPRFDGVSSVQYNELSKLYVEAKDNVKFLSTLERHFKVRLSARLSAESLQREAFTAVFKLFSSS